MTVRFVGSLYAADIPPLRIGYSANTIKNTTIKLISNLSIKQQPHFCFIFAKIYLKFGNKQSANITT